MPHDAATVVLLRPGPAGSEVLLTRRPATMMFAPGVHVFPGGRIVAIVVTRIDASHAAGAFDLGGRLGLPVHCGPGGAGWLPVPLIELADGDVVPGGDVPLRVVALGRGEGPDRGDPDDRGRIALVGDEGRIRLAAEPRAGQR